MSESAFFGAKFSNMVALVMRTNENMHTPLWRRLRASGGVGSWGIDNERTICTHPLEGLSGGEMYTQTKTHSTYTHTRAGPEPNPQAVPTSHHDTPLPKPIPQLQPMAVRVVHKLQHHPLGVARRTAPKAHTPNRSWHSAAPSNPSSHDRGAAGMAMHLQRAAAGSSRSWSRCSRSSAAPTSRSARPHSPVPASDRPAPRVRARRAVKGANAAQHARRSQRAL